MIKQICPHCLNPVNLPEEAAGKEVDCPLCKKPFPVQARYNPVVSASSPPLPPVPQPPEPVSMSTVPPDRPAPPPGYVPPPSTYLPVPTVAEPAPSAAGHYPRAIGLTFSPRIVAWLPAICLSLALFATFFSWVGVYVGGYAVYSQGPWKAMFGGHSVDRQHEAAVRNLIPDEGRWQDDIKSNWKLVLPYLLFLTLATIFAWAERGVASLDHTLLPPPLRWVRSVWPYRILFITALTTLSFLLIVIQAANGFGLQQAAKQNVAKKFEERRKEAGASASAMAKLEFEEEQELNKYNLEKTSFYYVGLGLHLFAALAILGRVGLDARGNKPAPRLVFQY